MTLCKAVSHVAIILGIAFTLCLSFTVFAKANDLTHTPQSSDLWNTMSEFASTSSVRTYLVDNWWADRDISVDELDYIIILAEQCSTFYDDRIAPELLLAMIAVESRFDPDCKTGVALGLMQIIPRWHYGRMSYFVEADTELTSDLFYNPRLSIMCGADYMSDLLDYTNGDIYYALMCYNQGQVSATKDYIKHGYISTYAETIVDLADDIRSLLYD